MIKVLQVVCNNEFNGTERYVVDLARHLPRDKFKVFVATPKIGPLSSILRESGIDEVCYDNGKCGFYSLKGLKNLYRIMRDLKIDIVHANAKTQPCLIAKLAGVKLIVETRHGIFYSKEQLDDLSFARKCYEYSKQFFVDYFIATSENDKAKLEDQFRINKRKIEVIYLGIDFDEIKNKGINIFETQKEKETGVFLIGHVGRMTYQKAQEYLISAFAIIEAKYHFARLVLVGSGENEDKLKKLVKEKGLEDKVEFRGYIRDIYKVMQTFNIHVLTSRYEGTGYVNLEAMALGVPFITPDVGGATNFFTSGVDCMISRLEDSASTALAIETLIADKELRDNIIRNAFETVAKYPVQRMAKETGEFYCRRLSK